MTYPEDTKELAEEIYVYDGKTLEQVCEQTQIPMPTLKQWSSDDGWFQKKKEYRSAALAIKHDTIQLQRRLTEKALETLDPQAIYALSRLRAATRKEGAQDQKEPDIDRPRMFLEDMEFAVKILQEVDPQALKVFGKHFGLIVRRWKDSHQDTKTQS